MFQFTSTATVLLMVLFYGITFLLSLRIKQKNENVDGYMAVSYTHLTLPTNREV